MQQKNKNISPFVQLSKTLSYLLRHGAIKEGLVMRQDGYVQIDHILQHQKLVKQRATLEKIRNVVDNNDKKRFEIQDRDGIQYIRCVQGHTIPLDEDQLLQKINDPNQFPQILHGTYFQAWELIKKTGLNRMARQHIHFAVGLPGQDEVISGMRYNVEVIIEVDMKTAMEAGIEFFLSKNGVVLSSGIDGVIPPIFFKSVTDRKGQQLPF